MNRFRADLHIHTCLSPCGDLSMDPKRVVQRAVDAGVDLMVVSDHNTTGNCRAVMEAAEGTNLCVLPGCEICSVEEIHLLTIYPDATAVRDIQGYLNAHLSGANTPEVFGYQIKADARGNFTGECTDFLIGALNESVSRVAEAAKSAGGLVICAHIDRRSFSIISQLGFIPDDLLSLSDAAEVTYPALSGDFSLPLTGGLPVVTASDAHFPDDIGRWITLLEMESICFDELSMAIRSEGGRSICGYEENRSERSWEAM